MDEPTSRTSAIASPLPTEPSVMIIELDQLCSPDAMDRLHDVVHRRLEKYCFHHGLPTPLVVVTEPGLTVHAATPVTPEQLDQLIGG